MEENGQVSFTDSAERARLDTDPMYKLEKVILLQLRPFL